MQKYKMRLDCKFVSTTHTAFPTSRSSYPEQKSEVKPLRLKTVIIYTPIRKILNTNTIYAQTINVYHLSQHHDLFTGTKWAKLSCSGFKKNFIYTTLPTSRPSYRYQKGKVKLLRHYKLYYLYSYSPNITTILPASREQSEAAQTLKLLSSILLLLSQHEQNTS